MATLVTTTQLAQELGVSRQTLSKAVTDKRLTVADRDHRDRPLFDLEVARTEWAKCAERGRSMSGHGEGKRKGGRPTKRESPAITPLPVPVLPSEGNIDQWLIEVQSLTNGLTYSQVDIIKKLWDAKKSELDAKKKEGQLIAVDVVRQQGAELGSILKGRLNAVPARLHQQLAAMTDPNEIYDLLVAEINSMIESVHKICGDTEADDTAE